MICPEFRHFWAGVELADSIVFNPHKWLGAQFDCSMQFIRQPEDLVRTLAIKPEFLKTHVILVSDQTKFERTAPVRIGHLSQVNTFITDRCDIPSVRKICQEAEVQLIETSLG